MKFASQSNKLVCLFDVAEIVPKTNAFRINFRAYFLLIYRKYLVTSMYGLFLSSSFKSSMYKNKPKLVTRQKVDRPIFGPPNDFDMIQLPSHEMFCAAVFR